MKTHRLGRIEQEKELNLTPLKCVRYLANVMELFLFYSQL